MSEDIKDKVLRTVGNPQERFEEEIRAGGRWRAWSPDHSKLWLDAEVLEFDPPRKLSHAWRIPIGARTPLGGRSYEYYAEDPVISGDFAAGVARRLAARTDCSE